MTEKEMRKCIKKNVRLKTDDDKTYVGEVFHVFPNEGSDSIDNPEASICIETTNGYYGFYEHNVLSYKILD